MLGNSISLCIYRETIQKQVWIDLWIESASTYLFWKSRSERTDSYQNHPSLVSARTLRLRGMAFVWKPWQGHQNFCSKQMWFYSVRRTWSFPAVSLIPTQILCEKNMETSDSKCVLSLLLLVICQLGVYLKFLSFFTLVMDRHQTPCVKWPPIRVFTT